MFGIITNFIDSFFDNVLRENVTPRPGSIVKCDLYKFEHTGIYVGAGKIVELCGDGTVRLASPSEFIHGTNALSIYVACNGTTPIGSTRVSEAAKKLVGKNRNYHILADNCHGLVHQCITEGKTGDSFATIFSGTFYGLEGAITDFMNDGKPITWRVWDLSSDALFK